MHIANGTLVMAIDGAKMLLFRNDGDEKYPVLTTLAHQEIESLSSTERGTDAPGRTFSSGSDRRSGYGETDWHQQAEDRFAAEAAARLQAVAAEEKGGIVIIAPPRLLGELRKHYDAAVEGCLLAEIDKDLVRHVTDDVIEAIAAHGG